MGKLSLTNEQNLNQSGYSGYGAILTVSRKEADVFPGTFMGALMGITAINVRTNVIPSYHMRSKGRFQSFAPGLRDGGEIAAAVNWLPGANDTQGQYAADWSLLRQATLESNELTKLRVFAPDPDLHLIVVDAFLTQLGPFSYQPEAIMSGQVGWKIVGAPQIITPIVYEVSGALGSERAVIHQVSSPSASETGSVATTIRLGGVPVSGPALAVSYESGDDNWDLTLTAGTPAIVGTTTFDDSQDAWIRLYVPGQYELWAERDSTVGAGFLTPAIAAETNAFNAAYVANGNRCFAAVYGSDEVL